MNALLYQFISVSELLRCSFQRSQLLSLVIQSSVNTIWSPSNITTRNQSEQHNTPIWCHPKYIEENDLDSIQFEHDELTDDECDNYKELLKDNLLNEGQLTFDFNLRKNRTRFLQTKV